MTTSSPAGRLDPAPGSTAELPAGRPVVVWGNCQAGPLAALIAPAVAAAGAVVTATPPVFEVTEDGVAQVRELVRGAAALITQPIRDEYRWPGCGSGQLEALLPPDARLVRIPVIYDLGPFPYQCNAHGGDGLRVSAPLTDYHDLRTVVAAERGLGTAETLAWWPQLEPSVIRSAAAESRAELIRRRALVDVDVTDLLGPGAMFTLSHPANRVLAEFARRILRRLRISSDVTVPAREFLGERRAPVESAVAAALGWPESAARDCWQVRGEDLTAEDVVGSHLAFYAGRPDVVADTRRRQAARLARLGL